MRVRGVTGKEVAAFPAPCPRAKGCLCRALVPPVNSKILMSSNTSFHIKLLFLPQKYPMMNEF